MVDSLWVYITKFHYYSLNACSQFSFDKYNFVGFFVGSKFYQPNQLSISYNRRTYVGWMKGFLGENDFELID